MTSRETPTSPMMSAVGAADRRLGRRKPAPGAALANLSHDVQDRLPLVHESELFTLHLLAELLDVQVCKALANYLFWIAFADRFGERLD